MWFLIHNMAAFDRGTAVGPAVWPHFDLLFVHEGRVRLRVLGRHDVALGAGDSILLYPQTRFEGQCETAARYSVLQFAMDDGPGNVAGGPGVEPFKDLPRRRAGFERYAHRGAPEVEADVRRALDLARREQTPLVRQMRLAMLTLILGQLRSQPPAVLPGVPHGQAFEPLIRWVQSRLDRPITVADMARQLNLSSSHFRALFRREVGHSAGQFLLSLRLNEARRLLRETQLPTKQIARMVGYSGVIPFAHSFTKHIGRTPAQYRRSFVA